MIQRRPRSSTQTDRDIDIDIDKRVIDDNHGDPPNVAAGDDRRKGRCIFVPDSSRTERQPPLLRKLRGAASARRRAAVASIVLVVAIISIVLIRQLRAYVGEYQGPLDHVTTSLLEPYYGMACPGFTRDDESDGNLKRENPDEFQWDCASFNNGKPVDVSRGEDVLRFPRIFMIGARDEHEDTFLSWNRTVRNLVGEGRMPHLERTDTLAISNQYALSGGKLRQSTKNDDRRPNNSTHSTRATKEDENRQQRHLCRKMKWEHRLFSVYQTVFSRLLSTYPDDDGFVVVEDDAVLKDPRAFVREACGAHRRELGFYSLYRSPFQQRKGGRSPSSCMYQHGTVAFYVRRHVMTRIVEEGRRGWFCRFPIDMYISKMGPWYATRREIVGHSNGSGRVGST